MTKSERSDTWSQGMTPSGREPSGSGVVVRVDGPSISDRQRPQHSEDADPPSTAASSDLCRVCVILLVGLEGAQMSGLL